MRARGSLWWVRGSACWSNGRAKAPARGRRRPLRRRPGAQLPRRDGAEPRRASRISSELREPQRRHRRFRSRASDARTPAEHAGARHHDRDFADGHSIDLLLTVQLSSPREDLQLYLRLLTAAGDTVFRNTPYPQIVTLTT